MNQHNTEGMLQARITQPCIILLMPFLWVGCLLARSATSDISMAQYHRRSMILTGCFHQKKTLKQQSTELVTCIVAYYQKSKISRCPRQKESRSLENLEIQIGFTHHQNPALQVRE
jgi:hypothetical protein